MIKLYKKEQLEGIKVKYSKKMLQEAKEDVAEIKANTIKGLLPEHTDIIKSDYGIDYYSSLFLLSDDYSVVVFSSKELHEILLGREL